jgi:hypothetical protein
LDLRDPHGASAIGSPRRLGTDPKGESAYIVDSTKPICCGKGPWRNTLPRMSRPPVCRPGRDRLSGRVEVDESYVGGLEEGVRGRQTETKALVAVACEEDGKGIGRIPTASICGRTPPQGASGACCSRPWPWNHPLIK